MGLAEDKARFRETRRRIRESAERRRQQRREERESKQKRRRTQEFEELERSGRKRRGFLEVDISGSPTRRTTTIGGLTRVQTYEYERTPTQQRVIDDSTIGLVSPAPKATGLAGIKQAIQKRRQTLTREDITGSGLNLRGSAERVGLGLASSGISTYEFGRSFFQDPIGTTKKTGKGIVTIGKKIKSGEGFPELGRVTKQEPEFALGYGTGEVLTAKGGGVIIEKGAKYTKAGATLLDPKFTRIKDNKLTVPTRTGPTEITVVQKGRIPTESLAKQSKLAGQEVVAVSGQRGLFGRFQKEVVIDKPKPTPGASELERSLFADPRGRARVSRIGTEEPPRAKITDILSGDVSLKKPKSQIIIDPKAQVERFPRSLTGVEAKLKTGKTLTAREESQLLKFQTTPSGQFKPIGFIGKESEITLPKGEVISGKRVGSTLIKGKRVDIFETEIKAGDLGKGKLTTFERPTTGITGVTRGRRPKTISSTEPISKPLLSRSQLSSKGLGISKSLSSQAKLSKTVTSGFSSGLSKVSKTPSYSFPSKIITSGTLSPPGKTSFIGGGGSIGRVIKQPPIIVGPPPKAPFRLSEIKGRRKLKKKRSSTQRRKYFSTAFASGFKITGRPTKLGIVSGLGLRPLKKRRGKL